MQGPRFQAFVNTGGVAARRARSSADAALVGFVLGDTLRISDNAFSALFGPALAALLRGEGLPLRAERQKEWKSRNAQKKSLEAEGLLVPRDFCPLPFFYKPQFDRSSLLKIVPFHMHHLEQWA